MFRNIILGFGLGLTLGSNINTIWYNKIKKNILIPINNIPIESNAIEYVNCYNRGVIKILKEIINI